MRYWNSTSLIVIRYFCSFGFALALFLTSNQEWTHSLSDLVSFAAVIRVVRNNGCEGKYIKTCAKKSHSHVQRFYQFILHCTESYVGIVAMVVLSRIRRSKTIGYLPEKKGLKNLLEEAHVLWMCFVTSSSLIVTSVLHLLSVRYRCWAITKSSKRGKGVCHSYFGSLYYFFELMYPKSRRSDPKALLNKANGDFCNAFYRSKTSLVTLGFLF